MRPTDDEILMNTARLWSYKSTCSRLSVGAVVGRDGRSIVSGFNGAPAGMKHCQHDPDDPTPCENATHAEANAIGYAAREGLATRGATLYITHSPCYSCSHVIIAAGIVRVVFRDIYRSDDGLIRLENYGILVEEMN